MKFSKKFISLFFISIASSCTYKYDGDNAIINDILESQLTIQDPLIII